MQDRLAQAGALDHRRYARVREGAGVDELVGEERQDHERKARGEGAEDRARAAVADDQRGLRECLVLRHPALDADVGRYGAEVEVAPRREQDPDVEARDRVQQRAVRVGAEPARDAAERGVDVRAEPARGTAGSR